jgi:Flp pilus assembly protein TadG
MNLLKRLKHDEHGLATVEAAIALPVLLLVMFGIMEGGLFIMTKHQMDRATREAARYCALYTSGLTLAQNKSRCTDNAATIIGQTLPGVAGTDWTSSVTFPAVAGAQAVTLSISKPFMPLTALVPSLATTLSASTTVVPDWS